MQYFFVLTFLLGSLSGFAQNATSVDHGPVLAVDLVTNELGAVFRESKAAVEFGYGGRILLNRYLSVSADLRFRTLQRQFSYVGLVERSSLTGVGFLSTGSSFVVRNGSVDYSLHELSIPVLFRYRPFKKIPVAILTGLAFNYRLSGGATERYDRIQRSFAGNTSTSTLLEEGIDRDWEFANRTRPWLPLGLAYQGDRLGIDVHLKTGRNYYRNGESAGFEGIYFETLVLACRYRLAAAAPVPLWGGTE